MSAQVGDVIATAEELDALPDGAVIADRVGCSYTRQHGRWISAQVGSALSTLLGMTIGLHPFTILYIPGRPPRPERVVKAEALREYAADIRETAGVHLRTAPLSARADNLAAAIDVRADRIEAGETR